jgi:hydrogenase 3 maturation protease
VLAVGNRMRGDDGFGPAVLDALSPAAACPAFDCGTAPENFAGAVLAADPEVVLALDAADHGGAPGALALVAGERAGGSGCSSHAAGLCMLGEYLRARCGAELWLLACQPARLGLGQEMSGPVREAVGAAARLVAGALSGDA